jgi:adenine-specific DNA-methyltransferase
MTTEGSDLPNSSERDQPDKLDLRSLDIAEERQQELLRLAPEAPPARGRLDFDRLKLALGETVDVGKERYGMSWPGKADCFRTIQAPSLGTLRPCPEESVAFDTTENLIIEGDNLEVLKLLQKSYLGKVKMIYIDPPYNTGNDFIYPDNYTESLQTYLEYTGQVDDQGHRFGTNTDTDGRFHSKWLNMMYPRLYLARNLLREDGVIFISIDDNEVDNLRKLCDEVFGEECFIGQCVVQTNPKGRVLDRHISRTHDYWVIYSRGYLEDELSSPKSEAELAEDYPEKDDRGQFRALELRNTHRQFGRHNRRNLWFPLYVQVESGEVFADPTLHTVEVLPAWDDGFEGCWTWGLDKVRRQLTELVGRQSGGHLRVFRKAYSHTEDGEPARKKSKTILLDRGLATERGQAAFDELMGKGLFPAPKPVDLVIHGLLMSTAPDDIVLDFFAGSGTTAHAVLDLNKQDGGNRKFILVQLPEPTGREDYPTIAEITKERVRRVIAKLGDEDAGKLDLDAGAAPDRGFRVFKLAESSFKPWNAQVAHDAQALEEQLDMHVDHVHEGRSNEDLLYEILLKSGFPLTTPVDAVPMAGKTVYAVAGGALFICLERELTLEVIRTMAGSRPERVVCLDEGFAGNDQLKANAVQIFKTKGVTSFKTV